MNPEEKNKILKLNNIILSSNQNFLIVEDDECIGDIIKEFIQAIGFDGDIFVASSLKEAVKILNNYKIDFICCDKTLPDGTGDSMLKAVRKSSRFYDIPVLMITGHSDIDEILLSSRLGSSEYLTKPFTQEDLKDKIVNGLKSHIVPIKEKIHELQARIIDLEEENNDLKMQIKIKVESA